MRSILILLFLSYFQVIRGGRVKRQFGMNNDDNPFINFDGQTSFEKQKANLMQELEMKLQELRQNNKQELANAVLELKHQLTGLGKTLLLSQTQQGLLLSAQAMRKDNLGAAASFATTTESSEEAKHRLMMTKLEALYKKFTKLTKYGSNMLKDASQEDDRKAAKKLIKLKNFEDSNSVYDLDYFNLDSAQQAKEMKQNNKKKSSKLQQKPLFWPKKPARNSEKPVVERPRMFDNQRQLAVERSFEAANKGGSGSDDQFYNQYIYYIGAAGLAIFAFCCYTMTAVDEVDLQTQKKLMKKREKEKRRERKRKRKKRRHSRKSKQKSGKESISVSPFEEQQQLEAIFKSGGNASATELKRPTVANVAGAVQSGFTLHQVDKADPVIVFEADKVHQFCGTDSNMATRLESMVGDSKLISQLFAKCLTEEQQRISEQQIVKESTASTNANTPASTKQKSASADGGKSATQTPNVTSPLGTTTVSPKSVTPSSDISLETSHIFKEESSKHQVLFQKSVSKMPQCKSK